MSAPTSHPGTAAHAAAERRAAARALLVDPILAGPDHAETLTLVRRHGTALKQTFATVLGYPLVIEAGFARLVKPPLPADAPARGARRSNGTDLTPRGYTYLSLVCAGLLAPGVGDQILVSALVDQLRADAAAADIPVDDSIGERRALVAAIDRLLAWGVLVETDGTVAAWGERHEEALLTINRALLPHVLARPLIDLTGPEDLLTAPADGDQPRRTLRRRLAENPLTRREDLTDLEADALSRDRREITRMLEETLGLTVEVRAEGALAYDVDEEITDITFPGQGTVKQAALLLIDALVDTLKPGAGDTAFWGGADRPGLAAPWAVVDAELADLAERNTKVWRADLVADLDRLRRDVVSTLTAMSLATPTDHALILHPACARYRPEPVRTAARPRRARTNPDPGPGDEALFTDSPQEQP